MPIYSLRQLDVLRIFEQQDRPMTRQEVQSMIGIGRVHSDRVIRELVRMNMLYKTLRMQDRVGRWRYHYFLSDYGRHFLERTRSKKT